MLKKITLFGYQPLPEFKNLCNDILDWHKTNYTDDNTCQITVEMDGQGNGNVYYIHNVPVYPYLLTIKFFDNASYNYFNLIISENWKKYINFAELNRRTVNREFSIC